MDSDVEYIPSYVYKKMIHVNGYTVPKTEFDNYIRNEGIRKSLKIRDEIVYLVKRSGRVSTLHELESVEKEVNRLLDELVEINRTVRISFAPDLERYANEEIYLCKAQLQYVVDEEDRRVEEMLRLKDDILDLVRRLDWSTSRYEYEEIRSRISDLGNRMSELDLSLGGRFHGSVSELEEVVSRKLYQFWREEHRSSRIDLMYEIYEKPTARNPLVEIDDDSDVDDEWEENLSSSDVEEYRSYEFTHPFDVHQFDSTPYVRYLFKSDCLVDRSEIFIPFVRYLFGSESSDHSIVFLRSIRHLFRSGSSRDCSEIFVPFIRNLFRRKEKKVQVDLSGDHNAIKATSFTVPHFKTSPMVRDSVEPDLDPFRSSNRLRNFYLSAVALLTSFFLFDSICRSFERVSHSIHFKTKRSDDKSIHIIPTDCLKGKVKQRVIVFVSLNISL